MLYGGGTRNLSDGIDFFGRQRFAFLAAFNCTRWTFSAVDTRPATDGAGGANADTETSASALSNNLIAILLVASTQKNATFSLAAAGAGPAHGTARSATPLARKMTRAPGAL